MANRSIAAVDIHELIRLKRGGRTNTEIGRLLGMNRSTVVKYVKWASQEGLLEGAAADVAAVQGRLAATQPGAVPAQQVSSLAPYEEEIKRLRAEGVEMAAIRHRLAEKHGVAISYEAVRRAVRRLEPRVPEAFVRVETAPGAEAQVDFGYAGLTLDPQTGTVRKTWVFVMVLSWSRHMYAELVYNQTVATWLACHRHAFAFFGGVPQRVVPDNLKAAIVRASFSDPEVQRSYRECAEHYGFLIDPNPPASPHLKGKVEKGGVHYVKRNFLSGRELESTPNLNAKLRQWCLSVAGARVHGTTRAVPLERFTDREQTALTALPQAPYDLAIWKKATIHRDCHIVFDLAYYSAPFRLVHRSVWVRGGTHTVKLYGQDDHALIACHDRAEAGERRTNPDHLPPHKLPGLTLTRQGCHEKAAAIGPATASVVEALLAHRPVDKLRVAGRLLRLAEPYGVTRLEAACKRALDHGDPDYPTVKAILVRGLDQQWHAPRAVARRVYTFARQAGEYAAGLLGGVA